MTILSALVALLILVGGAVALDTWMARRKPWVWCQDCGTYRCKREHGEEWR